MALNQENIPKSVQVSVKALDWESSSAEYLSSYGPIDTVVCADVVYDSSLIGPLVKVMHGFLTIGIPRILVSQTIRQEATTEELMQEFARCGIEVETLPWTDAWFYLEDGSNDIRLFSLSLI